DAGVADEWADLVALGTVADLVPLIGDNRALVCKGLRKLNPPVRLGLRALVKAAGLQENRIGTTQISYALAPRVNAPGRLADASICLDLLLSDDETRSDELAQ